MNFMKYHEGIKHYFFKRNLMKKQVSKFYI